MILKEEKENITIPMKIGFRLRKTNIIGKLFKDMDVAHDMWKRNYDMWI
jgi:hypothetical protein